MKPKSLLILCFVMLSNFVNASINISDLAHRWKITKHLKHSKDVPHKEDDFMQFDASNIFEEVLEGLYIRGNWTLNTTTNTLTINTGKEVLEWTITELTAHNLKASHKSEILEMEVVKLEVYVGDPYDDMTVICGKWKIAEHKAHYPTILHHGDYIQFFPDAMAEKVFVGNYKKMTWQYNGAKGEITIDDQIWKVKEMTKKKMVLENTGKNEYMVIIK